MESNMAEVKQRHGCLTTWLVLMIIANSLTALIYLLDKNAIKPNLHAPAWSRLALAVIGMANLVFSIALLRWKKWGFFGIVGTSILTLFVNLRNGVNPGFAVFGLTGVVMLYTLLQIGKDRKGWTQLE
jgi:hypothetical protein